MAASKYNFDLSIYSNCDKIIGIEAYLKTKRGSLSQHLLDCVTDQYYPIALCLDPTKTDQEVLLATIESLSNDSDQMAYKVNFLKASRGIDITPDMLSNFGLLPAIQYSSIEAIDSQQVKVTPLPLPLPSAIEDSKEIPTSNIDNLSPVIVEKEEEEEDDDYDPYEGMTDDEYLAATEHLTTICNVK